MMLSDMQFIITFETRGTVVQQAVVGKFMASKMTAPETALSARVTNHTAPCNGIRWTVHPKPSGVCVFPTFSTKDPEAAAAVSHQVLPVREGHSNH